jgi:hypothetical protein
VPIDFTGVARLITVRDPHLIGFAAPQCASWLIGFHLFDFEIAMQHQVERLASCPSLLF